MTLEDARLAQLETIPAMGVISVMNEWGYLPVNTKPDERDPDKWWAAFCNESTRTITYAFADTPEEAVRQAAIETIKKEGKL
jgi:hypothetical protein